MPMTARPAAAQKGQLPIGSRHSSRIAAENENAMAANERTGLPPFFFYLP